jgi:hypothetical protein
MGTPCHKNDIIGIKKKIDDYTNESRVGTQPAFSKQSSNLSMYMPKISRGQGTTLFDSNIAVNFFQNVLIHPYCNNPQLERHFYLFQPIPKVFPRNHVKSFSKVNKTTKKIGFSIVELLCNDPKGNKMVHS